MAETVFDTINAETDRLETRKKTKNKQLGHEEGEGPRPLWAPTARFRDEKQAGVSGARAAEAGLTAGRGLSRSLAADYALGKDCIMHGYMSKMGNPFLTQWQRRYFYLFPNRLEWRGEGEAPVRSGGTGAGGRGAAQARPPSRPRRPLPACSRAC